MGQCLSIRPSFLYPGRYDTGLFCQYAEKVTTDSFYWTNRIIAGLADAHYSHHVGDLEDYQESTMALGHARIGRVDQALAAGQTVEFRKRKSGK